MGLGRGVLHIYQEQESSWLDHWGPIRHRDIRAALGILALAIHVLRQLEVIYDVSVILNTKITPSGRHIFPTWVSCVKTFQNRSLKRIDLNSSLIVATVLGMVHTSKHCKKLYRKKKTQPFPFSGSCLHDQSVMLLWSFSTNNIVQREKPKWCCGLQYFVSVNRQTILRWILEFSLA